MKNKTVVYIVSDLEKSLLMEWTASGLSAEWDLRFLIIGKHESPFIGFLAKHNIPVDVIPDDAKTSLSRKIRLAYRYLRDVKPCAVHCHLWRANLVGLPAAFLARVPRRVYTRHHAMIHYREYPKGRRLDLICNWLATVVVAPSANVRDILEHLDRIPASKVRLIPHGVNLDYFLSVSDSRISGIKKKYNLALASPIVGVISRYVDWKGVQYIIPAFKTILPEFPEARLVLANTTGDFGEQIRALLRDLQDNSIEIEFEEDTAALFRVFDVFVHTPVDEMSEAFGQVYVEALAAGVPSVFTTSGIAREFVRHEGNALVVPFKDVQGIAEAIRRILSDDGLREKLVTGGRDTAVQYSASKMIPQLSRLYEE